MKFLTEEQEKIIRICKENNYNKILISANAGSGKTFTAKEVFNAFFSNRDFLPSENPKALYLVFNKSMSDFFKRSASKYLLDNCYFAERLDEIVETRTYHSFLKKGEQFEYALSTAFLPHSSELKINYAKSDLSKQDCYLIAKDFTNIMYKKNVIIDLDSEEKTLKQLRNYVKKIQEPIYEILKAYFSTATAIEDKKSCDEMVKKYNFDMLKIIPYENEARFLGYLKANGYEDDTISSYIIRELNYGLDRLISKKEIEVSHSYYYKRIYENAFAYDTVLEELFSPYKMIVVDECQDTDEMMFSLLKKYMLLIEKNPVLKNTKLICFGDNKQNIYKFSGSFNIFEWERKNPNFFYNLNLSQSFRYGQKIADFGKLISSSTNSNFEMKGSKFINDEINPKALNIEEIADLLIQRYSNSTKFVTKDDKNKFAIICRSNSKCIEIYEELRRVIKEKIEQTGKINGFNEEYVFLDSEIKGSLKGLANKKLISLINYGFNQDMLQSYVAKNKIDIKYNEMTIAQAIAEEKMHPFLKSHNFEYLFKYNVEFLEKLIGKRTKNNAFILITNCHQSKGKEYNTVLLGDDFFKRKDSYYFTEEEANISHTAITRAKNELLFYEGEENFLNYFYNKNIIPQLETKIDREFFQDIKRNRIAQAEKLEAERLEAERLEAKRLEEEKANDMKGILLGLYKK